MKTIASLIGVFFVVILFGAFFGLCMTLLFIYATDFVVGGEVAGVSANQALSILFFWAGAAAMATSFFTVVYTIRYPQNGFARIMTHTVLSLLVWLIVIPACFVASQRFEEKNILEAKEPVLTANYFRPDNGTLYYYAAVDGLTKTATGASFELNDINSATDGSALLENAPLLNSDIKPFSDVLIYDTLSISKLVDVVLPALRLSKENALEAFSGGIFSWLAFATWGLALYAIIGVRRLFHWRLLNFCTALLGFMGICAVNLCYAFGWDGSIFGFVTLPNWLLNCIIAAALSCMGIILSIFRPDPNMEHEE